MDTKTKIGITVILAVGALVVYDAMKKAHDRIARLEELTTPIGWVVLQDVGRFCAAHGGIKDLHRLAKNVYNVQCKDEAWFMKLKLQPQPYVVKPSVTLKEIM